MEHSDHGLVRRLRLDRVRSFEAAEIDFRQFFTVDQGERRRIDNRGEDLGDLAHSSRWDSILTLFRPDPGLLQDLSRALVALHYGAQTLADPRLGAVWTRLDQSLKALDCGFDRIESGTATEADEKQLFKDLETLQGLMVKDEGRRAEGGVMAQMADLRRAFLQDLADLKREQEKGA